MHQKHGASEIEMLLEQEEHDGIIYYPETGLVSLNGDITEKTANYFLDLAVREHKSITALTIDTFGGDSYAAFEIGEIVKGLRLPTVGVGKVFSAGAYLYALGKRRYSLPSSLFLIHAGSLGFGLSSSFSDVTYMYKFWASVGVPKILDATVGATKLPKRQKDQLKEDIMGGKEYYFDADESVKIGLTHELLSFDKFVSMVESF